MSSPPDRCCWCTRSARDTHLRGAAFIVALIARGDACRRRRDDEAAFCGAVSACQGDASRAAAIAPQPALHAAIRPLDTAAFSRASSASIVGTAYHAGIPVHRDHAGRAACAAMPMDSDAPDDDFPDDDVPDDALRGAGAAVELGAEPTAATAATEPGYWAISRAPLTSLVFALPLVVAYEGGVLLLGRGTPRNGADVWLRQALDALGFGSYFLLPTLTILGLLAWHHVEHDRWNVRPGVLAGMALECGIWAAVLIGVARLQGQLWPDFLPLAVAPGREGVFARLIGFCGAGLYEEVLFRLLLLPAVAFVLERLGASSVAAAGWAILATSCLFSLAHYVGPLGDTFDLYSFVFRALAGVFFSLLFVARGFGIVAGSHAVYDMFVGLW
jgi:hypothetical protein